jgi:hypothetical protein
VATHQSRSHNAKPPTKFAGHHDLPTSMLIEQELGELVIARGVRLDMD